MKSKIVIFKVLAAIIAVGGAFASVSANSAFAATSAYVNYSTADHTYCVKAGTCDRPGNFNCVVAVTIGTNPSTNYNAKRAGCTAIQVDSDAASDASITLPEDAVLK